MLKSYVDQTISHSWSLCALRRCCFRIRWLYIFELHLGKITNLLRYILDYIDHTLLCHWNIIKGADDEFTRIRKWWQTLIKNTERFFRENCQKCQKNSQNAVKPHDQNFSGHLQMTAYPESALSETALAEGWLYLFSNRSIVLLSIFAVYSAKYD